MAEEQTRAVDLAIVSVRVTPQAFRVLEAARLVYERRSLQALLRPVLEAYADQLATEPQVQRVLAVLGNTMSDAPPAPRFNPPSSARC